MTDRDLEHLELPQWREALPRRKHPGRGSVPVREDRRSHGQIIDQQAADVAERLQERLLTAPRGVNPKLIFKLQLHPKGNLDETRLRELGLRMLARDSRRAIVVFPDESTLQELRRRVREYAGLVPDGHQYGYVASIEAVTELTAEDRTGARLRAQPLAEDEVAALDVELWHSGDANECRRWIGEIRDFLRGRSLSVTDSYVGENLCLVRARVNRAALEVLLSKLDYIKEIDRRPQPRFELSALSLIDLPQLDVRAPEAESLTGVVVIDSGVAGLHPLLGPALGDAQVFPDRLRTRVQGGAEDGDQRTGGHGTAVAGIAVYGDIEGCIQRRAFQPLARLFSARVTDENNQYDEDELLEHQLEAAVEYFLRNYPSAKVINISLGDDAHVYSEGSYQFRLAAAVDELAYRHHKRDIVFVISAGNFLPDYLSDEEILAQYPSYLLDTDSACVIDPATSAIALTVGGLSCGTARDVSGKTDSGVERPVAGERHWPSPFTRAGWGVDGAIKPDVVDLAGDLRFERGRVLPRNAIYAGLATTTKDFAPPNGSLFRTVAGTSFAAPRVANVAARLFNEFPDASSNLVRALIADSARVPVARPSFFYGKESWAPEILRVYGYGQPEYDRARRSALNEVLLLSDSVVDVDSFIFYTVPPLPEEFLRVRGNGYISVTLAFDPPTRHTRGDSYLGVTMGFSLYKNAAPEMVAKALVARTPEEREALEEKDLLSTEGADQEVRLPTVQLNPGTRRRSKGTLQRGLARISGPQWRYDGGPLVLAVVCSRKWAPIEVAQQRFAVVVSLYHDDPMVDLYNQVRQHTRVYQRVRVRI